MGSAAWPAPWRQRTRSLNPCVVVIAERSLEDHEDVLSVHRDMQSFCRYSDRRFVFRKDYRKYEFFSDPQVSIVAPSVGPT